MKYLVYIFAFLSSFGATAGTVFAEYRPLSRNLPIIGQNWNIGIPALLEAFLGISVGIAAILAVIMLAIGGFKYMTTDSVFKMGDAKEQIANALIGLLIVLAAILILETINPNLVSLQVLELAPLAQ
jgi:hypothetical protein